MTTEIDTALRCTATEVRVYRGRTMASRPWEADLVFSDGAVWKGWLYGWGTRHHLEEAIGAMTKATIIRRKDMDR